MSTQVDKETKKQLTVKAHEALYNIFPKDIEGEVGVGKFRTTFHRVYEAGDGWMMGKTQYYIIVEVFSKLIKMETYFDNPEDPTFFISRESGCSTRLNEHDADWIYRSQINDAEITRSRREKGQPLT